MIQYRQRDPSAGNKGKYNNIVSRGIISMNPLNTSSTIHQKKVIVNTRVNAQLQFNCNDVDPYSSLNL